VVPAANSFAARLRNQSAGDDVVLSHAVADGPAVQELLTAVPKRQEAIALKGFEEPLGFVLVLSQRDSADSPAAEK
jgi:hypothetical protein